MGGHSTLTGIREIALGSRDKAGALYQTDQRKKTKPPFPSKGERARLRRQHKRSRAITFAHGAKRTS